MEVRFSTFPSYSAELVTGASLVVETPGEGLTEITSDARQFVSQCGARDGVLLLFLRHTSASLIIQENADRDVQTDLIAALRRLAPQSAPWIHTAEGPDDMPGHVRSMLGGVTLHVPVRDARLMLGTWQGIYLVEHRARPHRREVILQFLGSRL